MSRSPPNSQGQSSMALLLLAGWRKVKGNKNYPKSLQRIPLRGHQILPIAFIMPSAFPGLYEKSFPTACISPPEPPPFYLQEPFITELSAFDSFKPHSNCPNSAPAPLLCAMDATRNPRSSFLATEIGGKDGWMDGWTEEMWMSTKVDLAWEIWDFWWRNLLEAQDFGLGLETALRRPSYMGSFATRDHSLILFGCTW
jgi:hypothetical protein